jgi:hypothetical protein
MKLMNFLILFCPKFIFSPKLAVFVHLFEYSYSLHYSRDCKFCIINKIVQKSGKCFWEKWNI